MVEQGNVGALGLLEVSAEYLFWTRNPEIAVLDACCEIGATFVAFSPLWRGLLAGAVEDLD